MSLLIGLLLPNKKKDKLKVYSQEILIRLSVFKFFILTFLGIAIVGGMILSVKYDLTILHGIYEAISLMFFASDLPYPKGDVLFQILWIMFPILGLILLADGLAGIGMAIKFGDPQSIEWNEVVIKMKENHTILVGIGNVGFKVLTALVEEDENLVVVDQKDQEGREEEFEEFQRIHRIPYINGDASRERIMQKANITTAKAIMILIDNDLLNLKISLLARRLNPDIRIVARMFDLNFGNQIKSKIGIDKILSTSTISVPFFIDALIYQDEDTSLRPKIK